MTAIVANSQDVYLSFSDPEKVFPIHPLRLGSALPGFISATITENTSENAMCFIVTPFGWIVGVGTISMFMKCKGHRFRWLWSWLCEGYILCMDNICKYIHLVYREFALYIYCAFYCFFWFVIFLMKANVSFLFKIFISCSDGKKMLFFITALV